MSDFELLKSTNILIRQRPSLFSAPLWQEKTESGKPLPATKFWRDQRKIYVTWQIGIWKYPYYDGFVVGLLYNNQPTHFSYRLEDFFTNPFKPEKGFYFDAGTSCTELYVEPEEWKRVLDELEIKFDDDSWSVPMELKRS